MTDSQIVEVLKRFAKKVRRFGETSDEGMFISPSPDEPAMNPDEELNVQFCVKMNYGDADELFAAIRFLRRTP